MMIRVKNVGPDVYIDLIVWADKMSQFGSKGPASSQELALANLAPGAYCGMTLNNPVKM
jgi:hypothetical protein